MKKYNTIFMLIVIGGIVAVVSMNILLDVYHVFGVKYFNKHFLEANYRYLKVDYLKDHRDINAFVMGSSRANFYDVSLLNQLSHLKYYNLASPGEKIDRMLPKVAWLKKEGFKINHIIIALDFDVLFLANDLPSDAVNAKEHPLVSGESWFSFYFPQMFQFNFKHWRKEIKYNFSDKAMGCSFNEELGQWYYVEMDRKITENHEAYIQEASFKEIPYDEGDSRVDINLERLQTFIDYLKKNNISYTVINNPYHHLNYESFDKKVYAQWLSSVVNISGEVLDFAGDNDIVHNEYLYYETSHFRTEVGNMVIRRILSESAKVNNKEFGILLNAANIDQYVQKYLSSKE